MSLSFEQAEITGAGRFGPSGSSKDHAKKKMTNKDASNVNKEIKELSHIFTHSLLR